MNLRKILLGSCLAVLLLVVVAVGGWVWWRVNLPVFTMREEISADGRFGISYLTSNGVEYVHGLTEFALEEAVGQPYGWHWSNQIGITPEDMRISSVPGNSDYIVLSGFMFPETIYRKTSVPPIDLASFQCTAVELRFDVSGGTQRGQVRSASTTDPQILADITTALLAEDARQPLPAGVTGGVIHLLSPDLPGLQYLAYVTPGLQNEVYLSTAHDSAAGSPAGEAFTNWFFNVVQ